MTGGLVCGVDGGGSGCRVAIARADGTVIGRAEGGPANVATDLRGALAGVTAAAREAAGRAGLDAAALRGCAAHAGLAGVLEARDAAAVAAGLPFEACGVTDDRATSVAGALGARDGAVLSVGTGSFAALRRGGATAYLGGWGAALGDQASGAWLGRAALEHALLCQDGLAEAGALSRAVAERIGGPARIVAFGRGGARDLASLAPMVLAADDPAAAAILRRGAAYLAACLERLGLGDGDVLCVVGGLGPSYAPLLPPRARERVRAAQGDALAGALRLAAARPAVERLAAERAR